MVNKTYNSSRREKEQTSSKEQFIKRARTARALRQDVLDILTKEHIPRRRYYTRSAADNDEDEFDLSETLAEELENTNRIQNAKRLGKFTPDAALSIKQEHEENVTRAESLIQDMMGILLKPKSRDSNRDNDSCSARRYLSESLTRRADNATWNKDGATRETVRSFQNGRTYRSRVVNLDRDNNDESRTSKYRDINEEETLERKTENICKTEGEIEVTRKGSKLDFNDSSYSIDDKTEFQSETNRKTEELILDTKSAIQNTMDMLNELDISIDGDNKERSIDGDNDLSKGDNEESSLAIDLDMNNDDDDFQRSPSLSVEDSSITFQQRTRKFVEFIPPEFSDVDDFDRFEESFPDFDRCDTDAENEEEMFRPFNKGAPLHLEKMDEYIRNGDVKDLFLVDCSRIPSI